MCVFDVCSNKTNTDETPPVLLTPWPLEEETYPNLRQPKAAAVEWPPERWWTAGYKKRGSIGCRV